MSPCALWGGTISLDGYGRIFDDGRVRQAHRTLWERANGAIPRGLCICHRCDVKACVNLDHLFLGTHTDNMRDMLTKRRGWNQKKETCKRGHVFDKIDCRGRRQCRTCANEARMRRYYARKAA